MKKIEISQNNFNKLSTAYKKSMYFIAVLLLYGIAHLMKMQPSFFIMFMVYTIGNNFYQENFHTNSNFYCSLLSLCVFFPALCVIFVMKLWLMTAVFLGCLISFGSSKLAIFILQWKADKLELSKRNQDTAPFNLITCTEEQLRKRCQELKFKPDKIERAVQHFVLKLEHKLINPVRPESSETERNRMRKTLSK